MVVVEFHSLAYESRSLSLLARRSRLSVAYLTCVVHTMLPRWHAHVYIETIMMMIMETALRWWLACLLFVYTHIRLLCEAACGHKCTHIQESTEKSQVSSPNRLSSLGLS